MRYTSKLALAFASFSAAVLAGCSGSSSGSAATTATLTVTDAATDELLNFTVGLDSVELVGTLGNVELLQTDVGVDFAALTDLSRVLNVTEIPADTYTGVEVVLDFDNSRVVVLGENNPAALQDSDENPLAGTLTLPIEFTTPIEVTSGHFDIELDFDLSQSVVVDTGANTVLIEPVIVPRVNRADQKEHAVGGDLRFVNTADDFFTLGLPAGLDGTPILRVTTDSATVFQVDGVCLTGAAGLSALDNLVVGSWVQAFGSVNGASASFAAATVEAGTGSYNGGTDIVEGLITGRVGGAGQDAVLTVSGHSNDAAHTTFIVSQNFTINTLLAETKVVHRGSSTLYDTDELQIGQRVRCFGALSGTTLDCTTATDVVRVEPTHVFGFAAAAPALGELTIQLTRIDLLQESAFTWAEGGTTPADPNAFVLNVANLGAGQGITTGTPVEATGFFTDVGDGTVDFVATTLTNRELMPSLLLVRDRANGLGLSTTFATGIDFTFTGAPAGFEIAVVDQGFVGQVDIVADGITLNGGLGLYVIRDRALGTVELYLTFASFSQALGNAVGNGATIVNVGALGLYDADLDTLTSALAGVVVE
jgi:hypothetical protein